MGPYKIFISYAWGGESERVAEGVEKAFQKKGLEIIRDKKALLYKGSIKKFMQELGKGNAIIIVISDKYLKSKNCMFELLEIAENKDFYDRVFPIVLEDAKIYEAEDRIDYLKHWDEKEKELNAKLKGLDSFANTQGIREDIDLYTKIRAMLAGLVDTLGDMNTLTAEIHEDTEYEALYAVILEKLKERPSQEIVEPDESTSSSKISSKSPFPKSLTSFKSISKEEIIGREEDLKTLRKRLVENKKLSLINGMGGIGKTTLAAVYVEEYYDAYDHIAWLTIESSLEEAILANHDLLTNLKLQEIPPNELLSACLNRLRTMSSTKPGLLVLDNATQRLGKLCNALPKAPNWHVLVTSREIIEPFFVMELGFLTEKEAVLLFQKYNDKFTEEEVKSIVNEVEFHTLTIEILAKSARKNHWEADTVRNAIIENAKAGISTSHSGYEQIDRIKAYLIQIFKISKVDAQQEYLLKQFTALPNQWISYEQLYKLLQAEKLAWKDEFSGALEDLYEKGYLQKDEPTQ